MNPRRLVTCLLCALVLLQGTDTMAQQASDRGQDLYERAVTAFRAGEFDRAAELFGELYTLNPDPLVLYNRAYALGRAHRYPAAVEAAALVDLSDLDEQRMTKNRGRLTGYRMRITAETVAVEQSARETVTAPKDPPAPARPWLLPAIGSSVVAAGAWAATALVDVSIGQHVQALEAARQSGDEEAIRSELQAIEARQRLGRPLFVLGTVGTAAAATFFVLHMASRQEVGVSFGPGGLTIAGFW